MHWGRAEKHLQGASQPRPQILPYSSISTRFRRRLRIDNRLGAFGQFQRVVILRDEHPHRFGIGVIPPDFTFAEVFPRRRMSQRLRPRRNPRDPQDFFTGQPDRFNRNRITRADTGRGNFPILQRGDEMVENVLLFRDSRIVTRRLLLGERGGIGPILRPTPDTILATASSGPHQANPRP